VQRFQGEYMENKAGITTYWLYSPSPELTTEQAAKRIKAMELRNAIEKRNVLANQQWCRERGMEVIPISGSKYRTVGEYNDQKDKQESD